MKINNYLCDYIKKNIPLFICVFAIGMFSYGLLITDYHLAVDEENGFADGILNICKFCGQINRWAFFIYQFLLLPGIFYPFISSVLSIFFLSIAYVMYTSIHDKLSFAAKIIFCGLAISFPTLGPQLKFNITCAPVSCSAALIVVAYVYFIKFKGKNILLSFILPIALITFSLLTYQALILIFPALFIIDCLLDNSPLYYKKIYKKLFNIIVICFCAIASYFLISIILHFITGIPSNPYGESIYLNEPIFKAIFQILMYLIGLLKSLIFYPFYLLIIPFLIIIIANRNNFIKVFYLLLTVLYCISPWFFFGVILPVRALYFIPILYAGVFLVAYLNLSYKERFFFFIFSILVILFNSSINARLALLDYYNENRNYIIISRIYNQLLNNYPDYMKKAKNCLILGELPNNKLVPDLNWGEKDVYGASHLTDNNRVIRYLQGFGIELPPNLYNSNKRKYIVATVAAENMPAYPHSGFIKIIDETLVMRLSEPQPITPVEAILYRCADYRGLFAFKKSLVFYDDENEVELEKLLKLLDLRDVNVERLDRSQSVNLEEYVAYDFIFILGDNKLCGEPFITMINEPDCKLLANRLDMYFTKSRNLSPISIWGLSSQEPGGRWSGGKEVQFKLPWPLPKRFMLQIEGRAFGPNAGKNFEIVMGRKHAYFKLSDKISTVKLYVDNPYKLNDIKIIVPQPARPIDFGVNQDKRTLGLLFRKIEISPCPKNLEQL